MPVPLPSPRPSAISFTPPGLSISQNVGTTSPPQTITIANFGGSPLNGVNTVAVSGGFAETNNCPATLAGGSNCTVSVTFTPAATGTVTGALTVTDDSGNLGSFQMMPLSGTGTTPAATVTPTSLSFSSQVLGTSSTARSITVQSSGTGPLQVTGITLTGPFSQTNTCASALAPGTSCTIQVTFTPVALGSATGVVTITDNAGTQTVNVSGNGSNPVSLSPSSLSFGNMAVNETSAARTVTLTNRLNVALNLSGVTASGPFAISDQTCGTSVAVGGTCTVSVTFTPTALGSATGVLSFTDSALTSPQTVNLSGTGSLPVTFSPSSLNFNSVVVGATSAAQTLTLTNAQNVALNISGVVASGPFAIASTTCTGAIAAAANCTVRVTFTPPSLGTATGTLTFTDDATTSPQAVNLSGNGTAPVTVSSSSLNFGSVVVGATSSTRTVTLTNVQSVPLSITSITTAAPFAMASNSCGATLAAGARCTVGVTFSPTDTGSATGTLTFTDDAGNSPQTVNLSGTGTAQVTLSPSSLNFGTVTVGTTSFARTVTLTNHMSTSLTVSSVDASTGFAVASNTCGTVATGASCTVRVTFAPTVSGPATGTLTFTDSAGSSPQVVSLSGTGQ